MELFNPPFAQNSSVRIDANEFFLALAAGEMGQLQMTIPALVDADPYLFGCVVALLLLLCICSP
jgi:hypothetical protein